MTSHVVHLIIDVDFDGDLWALSRDSHVWIVGSEKNSATARMVWDRDTEGYSPLRGVTTFAESPDPLESVYGLLGAIDMHHGRYSAPRPWDIIHVHGLEVDTVSAGRVAQELSLESVELESEAGGFAIRRAVQPGDATDRASPGR